MTIVAAVDRSDHAVKVASEAAKLADAFDEDLHIVYVLSQSNFLDLERTSVEEKGTAIDMDEIRAVARRIADKAGEELDRAYEPIGLVGNPKDRVVDYADEHDARYLVLGPRKQSPTGKIVFGSVAQAIMLNSSVPVVTILKE